MEKEFPTERKWLVRLLGAPIQGPLASEEVALFWKGHPESDRANLLIAHCDDWRTWTPLTEHRIGAELLGLKQAVDSAPPADSTEPSLDALALARLNVRAAEEAARARPQPSPIKTPINAERSEFEEMIAATCPRQEIDAASESRLAVMTLGRFLRRVVVLMAISYALARIYWVLPTWNETVLMLCWGTVGLFALDGLRVRWMERRVAKMIERKEQSRAPTIIDKWDLLEEHGLFFFMALASFFVFLLIHYSPRDLGKVECVPSPSITMRIEQLQEKRYGFVDTAFVSAKGTANAMLQKLVMGVPVGVNFELQRLGGLAEAMGIFRGSNEESTPLGSIPEDPGYTYRRDGVLIAILLLLGAIVATMGIRWTPFLKYRLQISYLLMGAVIHMVCLATVLFVPQFFLFLWPVVGVGPAYCVKTAYSLRKQWDA